MKPVAEGAANGASIAGKTIELGLARAAWIVYAKEVIERAHRLVCEMLERAMDQGMLRRTDPLVAARMLSALFVTHALWYHQGTSIKSIAHIPDDVIFGQLRDFFLHAMRPDSPAVVPHA